MPLMKIHWVKGMESTGGEEDNHKDTFSTTPGCNFIDDCFMTASLGQNLASILAWNLKGFWLTKHWQELAVLSLAVLGDA